MMKKIKVGNAIACEYVAQGNRAKHVLVNTYGGDIIVAEFPAIIPLAFYLEFFPDSSMPNEITFRVTQGKKIRAEVTAEFDLVPNKLALAVLPTLPFTIPKNTEIRVTASCEGFQPTILIRKKVILGPVPVV